MISAHVDFIVSMDKMDDWLLPELVGNGEPLAPEWPRVPTPPPAAGATGDGLYADLLQTMSIENGSGADPAAASIGNGSGVGPGSGVGKKASMPPHPHSPYGHHSTLHSHGHGLGHGHVAVASVTATNIAKQARAQKRREFHKIHTRRSRAKLNERMEKLLSQLPTPPPNQVIKSKAQILDYAIEVIEELMKVMDTCPRCSDKRSWCRVAHSQSKLKM